MIAILFFVFIISLLLYFNQEIRLLLASWRINTTGGSDLKIHKVQNQWKVFDFSNIPGETKYLSSIIDKHYPALEKYRIWNIKIFKDIGFILANNEEQIRATFERKGRHIKGQRYTNKDIYNSVQAYIFKSTDNGKSFDKIAIGKGVPKNIDCIKNECLTVVDHKDTHSSSVWVSHDNGKNWKNIQNTANNIVLTLIGIVKKGHYIFEIEEYNKDTDSKHYLVYSNDGGIHFHKLPEIFQQYYTRPIFVTLYKNRLFFVVDNTRLVSIDLVSNEVGDIELNIPEEKYIFKIEQNKESEKIYLTLYDYKKGSTEIDFSKKLFYYPLENKKIPIPFYHKNQHEYIMGEYIGLFARVKGILMHSWTKDGKTWYYELLPNFLIGPYANGLGSGYGQIWLKTEIYNPKLVPQKGSYLSIGKYVNK